MADDQTIYETKCKHQFEEIKRILIENAHKTDKMYNDMFIGNGQPPHSVQLDRLNRFMKVACWFGGVIVAANIALVFKLLYNYLT